MPRPAPQTSTVSFLQDLRRAVAMAHWLEARRPLMAALAGLMIFVVALGMATGHFLSICDNIGNINAAIGAR